MELAEVLQFNANTLEVDNTTITNNLEAIESLKNDKDTEHLKNEKLENWLKYQRKETAPFAANGVS